MFPATTQASKDTPKERRRVPSYDKSPRRKEGGEDREKERKREGEKGRGEKRKR